MLVGAAVVAGLMAKEKPPAHARGSFFVGGFREGGGLRQRLTSTNAFLSAYMKQGYTIKMAAEMYRDPSLRDRNIKVEK
jgi:hypothetical protein